MSEEETESAWKLQETVSRCLLDLAFDKAKDAVDGFLTQLQRTRRSRVTGTAIAATATTASPSSVGRRDSPIQSFVLHLQQLIACERSYFQLAFLAQRTAGLFRKDAQLINVYSQIRDELGRSASWCALSEVGAVLDMLRRFVVARLELFEVWQSLGAMQKLDATGDGTDGWKALAARLHRAERDCVLLTSERVSWSELIVHETRSLRLLIEAHIQLAELDMLNSLLSLSRAREQLEAWLSGVLAANQTPQRSAGFLSSLFNFDSSPSSSSQAGSARRKLLSWLVQFYQLLVARFSLYHGDALSAYMRTSSDAAGSHKSPVFGVESQPNLCAMCTSLSRKNGVDLVVVVANRANCSNTAFYGTNYHGPEDIQSEGIQPEEPWLPAQPITGPAAVVPCLLRIPSTKSVYDRHRASIERVVSRGEQRPLFLPDKELEQTLFVGPIENNIYLVVVLSGVQPDREPAIMNLFNQLESESRGRKLFASLRTVSTAKS